MNLSELRDLVRAEAGIEGDDIYQVLIDAIINQEYNRISGKSKYNELHDEVTFTATAVEEFEFTLPDDYQLFDTLTYLAASDTIEHTCVLSKGTNPRAGIQWSGSPKFWYRNGSILKVYPYTDVSIGDTLILGYYKKQILVDDADELLVPMLEKTILLSSIARLAAMKDTRKGQVIAQNANVAYLETRSENAGS